MTKQTWLRILPCQCYIQSYFEAGMPVWYPKLRFPLPSPPHPSKKKNWQIITVRCHRATRAMFGAIQKECKITKTFCGFAPGLHSGGLTVSPHPYPSHPLSLLRMPCCIAVFLVAMLVKKPAPPKKVLDAVLYACYFSYIST